MLFTRCEHCSFEYKCPGPCPYCTDNSPPALYGSWWCLVKSCAGLLLLDSILILSAVFVYAAIVYGQEQCPQRPERIEYYTLDDGTQVPFSYDFTARHQYRSLAKTDIRRVVPDNRSQQPRQTYRPEVRQRPFTNSTRTTPARVAVQVNTSSTIGSRTGSTYIPARDVVSRGDTKP